MPEMRKVLGIRKPKPLILDGDELARCECSFEGQMRPGRSVIVRGDIAYFSSGDEVARLAEWLVKADAWLHDMKEHKPIVKKAKHPKPCPNCGQLHYANGNGCTDGY